MSSYKLLYVVDMFHNLHLACFFNISRCVFVIETQSQHLCGKTETFSQIWALTWMTETCFDAPFTNLRIWEVQVRRWTNVFGKLRSNTFFISLVWFETVWEIFYFSVAENGGKYLLEAEKQGDDDSKARQSWPLCVWGAAGWRALARGRGRGGCPGLLNQLR